MNLPRPYRNLNIHRTRSPPLNTTPSLHLPLLSPSCNSTLIAAKQCFKMSYKQQIITCYLSKNLG